MLCLHIHISPLQYHKAAAVIPIKIFKKIKQIGWEACPASHKKSAELGLNPDLSPKALIFLLNNSQDVLTYEHAP